MKDLFHSAGAKFVAAMALLGAAYSIRANVFVSDIELNGSLLPPATEAGNPVAVSYILSDAATSGVSVNVYSNGVPIRTFSVLTNALATNGAGLSRGTNTVLWDGLDSTSNSVGVGTFSVSVTASSLGHAAWTLLTSNAIKTNLASGGYYTWAPRGIALNTDSNSLSYGRVFVANAQQGPNPATVAGDHDSILMFNADGSASDAGAYGDGGYDIHQANFELPQKLRAGDDDRLYMNDLDEQQVAVFDFNLQTNAVVLNGNNYFDNPFIFDIENGVGWYGLDVTLANTTNAQIWLGESDVPGAGVWFWQMIGGVANPQDHSGTNSVGAGFGSALSLDASGGFMADTNDDVFVSQYVDDTGDTNYHCMLFTNANALVIETNAAWAVGGSDDTFRDISDTTIDSRIRPQYVACGMSGPSTKGIRILDATNGETIVANLDPTNTYYATAWDGVGNLYGASDSLHAWRVWSPPGNGNTSTTTGFASIKTVETITILSITNAAGQVSLTFTAASTNALSNFTLLSSSDVGGTLAPASGASFGVGGKIGLFTATVPTSGPFQFYIIKL